MRTIFVITSWIAVAVFSAYLAGVRVIVIQPLKGMPSGGTAVVWGISGYRLIDSPDAKCRRDEGAENIYCRITVMKDIADNGKVLLRLPYSEYVLSLTKIGG